MALRFTPIQTFFRIAFFAFSTLLGLNTAFSQATYYARADGTWNNTNTWSTISCVGPAAGTLPGASDNVIICAGRTVTYTTGTNTVASLTVELTAVLTHTGGNNANLIARTLVLDGTINGNGDGDVRIGGVGGATLSGIGFYSKSTTSGQLRLLGNISVLPGTDLKFNGNATFSLRGFTVTNNGRISILHPSNFSNGGTFINNSAASYLLYTRQANFPNTTLTATVAGNTVEFGATTGGPWNMNTQSSYHHLIISGDAVKRINAATTTIRGDLTISSGSTLNANTGTRNINIAGNWNNNLGGSFVENTSTVTFNGSTSNQILNPPAGAAGETFYDLTINNTFAGGSVTATGNVTITNNRTLRMTAGIFEVGTNTLSQASGNANLVATGGDLRMGKLATTLPEFTGTYTITGGTITFNGSAAQTIRSLNTAPANYHHIVLTGAGTKTMAGNILVRGDWTNIGSTRAGNFTVTFGGSGVQTITNAAGESFFGLTVNTTGPLTIASTSSVTVTSTLTMTSGNINLNGRTLTVGDAAGATLVRTNGTAYGGVFRRYFPTVTISSSAAPLYGLFPVGTNIYYRPVEINSTINPVTAGYVSVEHIDATTVTDVSYTDNEGDAIQRVTDMRSVISTATLAGGTYNLNVTMSALSAAGVLTDLKLETLAGPPYGVGTSLATSGTVASPVGRRTGLSVANLNNTFVIGTKDKSTTPLVASYYSRRTGNWKDATVGNATWSLTDGGPSCNCIPIASSVVFINPGHTVTITTPATADFVNIRNTGIINGTSNFTVNYDLTTFGTGRFSPTAGSWSISRNLNVTGTSSSSSAASLTITGSLTIDAGNSLTMSNSLSVATNLTVHGTLAMGTNGLTLSGTGTSISGNVGVSAITGSGTITITGNKTIDTGSNLTIGPVIHINAATMVTNQGNVTHLNNLTGGNAASSVWANASNSVLTTTGNVLTTGVLLATTSPNTVNYNGSGAQIVKGTTYSDLYISNAGTKTAGAAVTVNDNLLIQNDAQFAPGQNVTISDFGVLTIQDNAIFDQGTNTLTGTNADLVMTGNSEFRMGRASNGTYPELTGNYSLTGGTIVMNPASNTYGIRGVAYYNLTLSGSGASVFNFNSGVFIDNNLLVTLSGTSRFVTITDPLTVTNNFTFNSTSTLASTLTNDLTVGTFTLTAGTLTAGVFLIEVTLPGGWTRNGGTFNQGTSTVIFSGNDDQTIGGSLAGPYTFHNVEIDNIGLSGVTLNRSITINGTLTLTQGNIIATTSNLVTMAAGSSVTGASDNSFVDGPVAKIGNTDFTFPVGKDGVYRPISISGITVVANFRAEYFHADPNGASYNTSSKDPTLYRVNSGEYWILDRTLAPAHAFVTLSWNDYSGIVANPSSLAVARWDGSVWRDHGNGGTTGSPSPGTGTVRSLGLVTSFSPFTIASLDDLNPLPVELVSLKAMARNSKVEIAWITASELNNDYFTVERSADAESYEEVTRVAGAGTTSRKTYYSILDSKPYSGTSYYRLRQTDYDGTVRYYGPVSVTLNPASFIELSVYPNPANGSAINIDLSGYSSRAPVMLRLRDTTGRDVYSCGLQTDESGSIAHSLDSKQFIPGIFILSIISETEVFHKKIIIN